MGLAGSEVRVCRVNRCRFALVGRLHALAAEAAGLPVARLALALVGEYPVVSQVVIGPVLPRLVGLGAGPNLNQSPIKLGMIMSSIWLKDVSQDANAAAACARVRE
jgi:hypothetical protein